MIRRDDGEISTILGLLETDELFHTMLLVIHLAGDVGHGQDIEVGEIAFDSLSALRLPEHLADVLKQRVVKLVHFRQKADGEHLDHIFRESFFQPFPHTTGLLRIGGNGIQPIAEQGHGVAFRQQHFRLFVQGERLKDRGEEAVYCAVKGIDRHCKGYRLWVIGYRSWLAVSC